MGMGGSAKVWGNLAYLSAQAKYILILYKENYNKIFWFVTSMKQAFFKN